jgi:hypothetical protein
LWRNFGDATDDGFRLSYDESMLLLWQKWLTALWPRPSMMLLGADSPCVALSIASAEVASKLKAAYHMVHFVPHMRGCLQHERIC